MILPHLVWITLYAENPFHNDVFFCQREQKSEFYNEKKIIMGNFLLGCCISHGEDDVQALPFTKELREGMTVDRWLVPKKVARVRVQSSTLTCRLQQSEWAAKHEIAILKAVKLSGHTPLPFSNIGRLVGYFHVPGLDLNDIMNQRTLEREEVMDVFYAMGKALGWCHLQGIAHLDVKPENIVVGRCMRRATLVDFEFAMMGFSGMGLKPLPRRCGTVGFVAPEILADAMAGCPSDTWSLMCTLYTLVARTPPQWSSTSNNRAVILDVRNVLENVDPKLGKLCVLPPSKRPLLPF